MWVPSSSGYSDSMFHDDIFTFGTLAIGRNRSGFSSRQTVPEGTGAHTHIVNLDKRGESAKGGLRLFIQIGMVRMTKISNPENCRLC